MNLLMFEHIPFQRKLFPACGAGVFQIMLARSLIVVNKFRFFIERFLTVLAVECFLGTVYLLVLSEIALKVEALGARIAHEWFPSDVCSF